MLFKATFTKRFGRRTVKQTVITPSYDEFLKRRDELIAIGYKLASYTQVPRRLS